MAYTDLNFKTKKELKDALKKGVAIAVYNNTGLGITPKDGRVFLEGPHYPAPHAWYAEGVMAGGRLVKIKS